jgi:hypothetical protein
MNVVLDAVRDQLRVGVFLSEVKAQKLAMRLRQHAHIGSLAASFHRFTAKRLAARLRGHRPRRLRIIHPRITSPQDREAAVQRLAAMMPPQFISKVQEWVVGGFTESLKSQSARFLEAADQPADGVTLVVTVEQPAGLKEICAALAGNGPGIDRIADAVAKGSAPRVTVDFFPGHKCE